MEKKDRRGSQPDRRDKSDPLKALSRKVQTPNPSRRVFLLKCPMSF